MIPSALFSARADAIMGILWAFAVIASVMLALRLKLWLAGNGQAAWALLWAGTAYVVGIVSQALLTISFRDGMGGHITDVEAHGDLVGAIKWGWISSSINLFGIAFGKWSVIAFLLALHGPTHYRSRFFLLALAGLNMACDAALCFVIMFQCNPPSAIWDLELQAKGMAECGSPEIQRNLGFVTGSINSATDFILAAYPVILFRHSQTMPFRKKVFICLLMSAGVVGGASGIAKAYQIQNIESSHDQTWDTSLLWVWTWTELWIILIAACMPPLAPFLKDICCCIYPREGRAPLDSALGRYRSETNPHRAWLGLPASPQTDPLRTRRYPRRSNDTRLAQRHRHSLESILEDQRPLSRDWYRQFGWAEEQPAREQGKELEVLGQRSHPDPFPENGIAVTKDVTVRLETLNDPVAGNDERRSHCATW